jgi:membrane complex biogenesis BtpA family protein
MNLPKLVGVIHLPPLAGSPGAHHRSPAEALQAAGMRAVEEAQLLARAGYDGVILENFGDLPFYKDTVPPETVASLSVIAGAVREVVDISIGINVLRNDARAALAIASVTGCDFIRVNILSGIAATDQGLIEGQAAWLIRERDRLHAEVGIFADVHVKHAVTLSSFDIGLSIEELGLRAKADAVILTGPTTGRLVDRQLLEYASEIAKRRNIPLYLGSGVTRDQIKDLLPLVNGMIVGSDLRLGGVAGEKLDQKRLKAFIQEYRKAGGNHQKTKTRKKA